MFPEYVRDTADIYIDDNIAIDSEELELTKSLVKSMKPIDVSEYQDKWTKGVLEILAGKTPEVEVVAVVDNSKALKEKLRLALQVAQQ